MNEDVALDSIKASLRNGVLELVLPKKEVKKIEPKKSKEQTFYERTIQTDPLLGT